MVVTMPQISYKPSMTGNEIIISLVQRQDILGRRNHQQYYQQVAAVNEKAITRDTASLIQRNGERTWKSQAEQHNKKLTQRVLLTYFGFFFTGMHQDRTIRPKILAIILVNVDVHKREAPMHCAFLRATLSRQNAAQRNNHLNYLHFNCSIKHFHQREIIFCAKNRKAKQNPISEPGTS